MEWWKGHEEHNAMSHWTCTCKLVLLVQPSLAAAERLYIFIPEKFFHFSAGIFIGGLFTVTYHAPMQL